MVNFETVEFIGLLNDLARKTGEGGIKPFSEAKEGESRTTVFYDENSRSEIDDFIKYDDVVCNCLVCADHHDIVSRFNSRCFDFLAGCRVYVREDTIDTIRRAVCIHVDAADLEIIIENGSWYVC